MQSEEAVIGELIATYIAAFNAADFPGCLVCYRLPFTFISNGGVSVVQDAESFLAMWSANHAELRSAGWSHSVLLETDVRMLDERLAMASTAVARHRADGSEMGVFSGLYSLRKGRDGWRLIAVVTHRFDTRVKFV